MKKIEDSKEIFDQIKIPAELKQVVETTMKENGKEILPATIPSVRFKIVRFVRYSASVAVAALLIFTVTLNTNEAFAQGCGTIPIIGNLAKVLTVTSYEKADGNEKISVQVPAVELNDNQANTDAASEGKSDTQKEQFVADVNAEIAKIVDDYTKNAQKGIAEYKDAFISTGGTQAEWDKKDIKVNVKYDVKYEQGNILSLVLTADENWCSAYNVKYYYNLDMKDNKRLTLKDVLGEDYINKANDAIVSQMKDRVAKDKDYLYWGIAGDNSSNIDGFTSVSEDSNFYINEAGNPVVCFNKYDVAPGFMGAQEFEIAK